MRRELRRRRVTSPRFGGDPRWLGHPAFFGCSAVLLFNDQLLKARFSGWWTGKLSDFAGTAVVGVILAVVTGPRRGLAITAVSFTALKVVPGVAEMAAPVLGGVTRRDPTDIVALVVLLPLRRMLAPTTVRPGRSASTQRSTWRVGRDRSRAALAAVAPIVGLVVAASAATATSCGPSPAVIAVAEDGDALFALVRDGLSSSRWERSTDGGLTWRDAHPPSGAWTPSLPADPYEDPRSTGRHDTCASDGTCWRLRDRRAIERIGADGAVVEELRLSDAQFAEITTGCQGGSIGVLGSIASAESDGEPHAVASFGADGVLVRQGDGTWEQVRLFPGPPSPPSRSESVILTGALAFGPVLGAVVWVFGRSRWPSWQLGVGVTSAGWLATISVAAALDFLADSDGRGARIGPRVAVAGMVVTAVGTILVARRPLAGPPTPQLAPDGQEGPQPI